MNEDVVILAAFNESTVLVFAEKEVLGFAALYGNQLRAMFVRRDVRGKGVGHALLNAARKAQGELVLNVAKSNIGARRFYASNGFVVMGEDDRLYQEIAITYVQMKSSVLAANSGEIR